jgi:hypothetical protein
MRIFGKRRKRKELDSKSKHVSIMYLSKSKTELERQLRECKKTDTFTIQYDIRCLENAIEYLENSHL